MIENKESYENIEALIQKIEELKHMSEEHQLDLSDAISNLESKISELQSKQKAVKVDMDTWDRVQLSRHIERPTTLDYIQCIFDDFIELHGDRLYADDPAMVGGIATFNGIPVTVIGNQKGQNTKENLHRRFGMSQPEGYRKALRLMQQANKFKRPIITFINTAGAFPGKEAEERGQSEAIARNLREMASFGVPIICFVIGEGGSGGALALSIGNKIYMLENTFYSVISPEGAAALLWKDATQAKRAAEALKVSANDLYEFGIVDEVVPEPVSGAHTDLQLQVKYIRDMISRSLSELLPLNAESLIEQRYEKFRKIGEFEETR
ncbi:acetyl-CoA carboxylase carboxyltransferase subunit alpha [Bacillus thuringiensis]|nr:acetyl-CoA carboxylase carboxyltransferase subunit alpha [Bacillus thuringiensis]MCU7667422.1 acetyl-CoA carboxylase carboxyltransferase subunit alpha [Bacillus thuringiensis]